MVNSAFQQLYAQKDGGEELRSALTGVKLLFLRETSDILFSIIVIFDSFS